MAAVFCKTASLERLDPEGCRLVDPYSRLGIRAACGYVSFNAARGDHGLNLFSSLIAGKRSGFLEYTGCCRLSDSDPGSAVAVFHLFSALLYGGIVDSSRTRSHRASLRAKANRSPPKISAAVHRFCSGVCLCHYRNTSACDVLL